MKPEPVEISGTVRDYYTHKALPGVKVRLREDEVTYTAEDGSFTLRVDKSFLKAEMNLSVNEETKLQYQGLADEYLGTEVPVSSRGPSFGLEVALKPSGTVQFSWPPQLRERDTLRIYTAYDTLINFVAEDHLRTHYTYSDFDSLTTAYYCFHPDTSHRIKWRYHFKDSISPILEDVFHIPNSFKFPGGAGTTFKTAEVRLK